MSSTIADGKKMKIDTLFVECVEKSWDVQPFVKSVFVKHLKRKKKDI